MGSYANPSKLHSHWCLIGKRMGAVISNKPQVTEGGLSSGVKGGKKNLSLSMSGKKSNSVLNGSPGPLQT